MRPAYLQSPRPEANRRFAQGNYPANGYGRQPVGQRPQVPQIRQQPREVKANRPILIPRHNSGQFEFSYDPYLPKPKKRISKKLMTAGAALFSCLILFVLGKGITALISPDANNKAEMSAIQPIAKLSTLQDENAAGGGSKREANSVRQSVKKEEKSSATTSETSKETSKTTAATTTEAQSLATLAMLPEDTVIETLETAPTEASTEIAAFANLPNQGVVAEVTVGFFEPSTELMTNMPGEVITEAVTDEITEAPVEESYSETESSWEEVTEASVLDRTFYAEDLYGSRNQEVSFVIQGIPGVSYSIYVYAPSGHLLEAEGLYPKPADLNGYVSWSWKIGGRTNPGQGSIVIVDDTGYQQSYNYFIQ